MKEPNYESKYYELSICAECVSNAIDRFALWGQQERHRAMVGQYTHRTGCNAWDQIVFANERLKTLLSENEL